MLKEVPAQQKVSNNYMGNEGCQIIAHNSWEDFIAYPQKSDSIYRGHSNFNFMMPDLGSSQFKEWKLISTWYRENRKEFWSFASRYSSFMQGAGPYKIHLDAFVGKEDISKISMLQFLQYFQHYGIPTPLIDFTLDKDVALYIAFSGIKEIPCDRQISTFNDFYITIYELRTRELIADNLLKVVDDQMFNSWENLSYQDFFLYKPEKILGNGNIKKQSGLFLYLDCDLDVEGFIFEQYFLITENYEQTNNKLKKILIKHRIPYNSLFKKNDSHSGVFPYLLKNQKLGAFLFDDIRGIHFDMNNPGIKQICIHNMENCECLKRI